MYCNATLRVSAELESEQVSILLMCITSEVDIIDVFTPRLS